MEQFYEQFDGCIQKEVPFCQASCPFHIDILDFIEKMGRGAYNAAYKTYRNAVTFPAIVSELCYEPCKAVCPRGQSEMGGSPIDLKALEKTLVREATKKEPIDYNVPKKDKHIAIIGAGLSGLACALRLASKKYDVTVYEASSGKGGSLLDMYPEKASLFLEDIELQMMHEDITFHFDKKINSISELKTPENKNYDAVYVATGKGGLDFGLLENTPNLKMIDGVACFAGGSLRHDHKIESLADGIRAATHIEAYLKTGNLFYPDDDRTTKVQIDPSKTSFEKGPSVGEDGAFSQEDAVSEAQRCLRCSCDSCMIYCDLVAYTNKWPLRIRDEVKATMHDGQADLKPQPAKRLVNFCTHCGLCKEVCPAKIDMDNMFLAAKAELHGSDRMSWGFHDFWERDMDHANSELSALVRIPPGFTSSKFAFFPGCQLGASDNTYVSDTYKLLLSHDPSTALFLKCCGVPVKWAGNTEGHKATIEELRSDWESLGKPTLIVACPSCINNIKEFLPEIPIVSLYEFLADNNLLVGADDGTTMGGTDDSSAGSEVMSIFDPCASTGNEELRNSVRKIAKHYDINLQALPVQEQHSACCSFGGQVSIAGPKYADFIIDRRINESDNPYITYCINCRDAFLGAGKKTIHLLDLVLNRKLEDTKDLPTVTARRENRYNLKKNLLKDVWSEDIMSKMPKANINLIISPEMKAKLDREKILEEEIVQVVEFCERTGRKVENKERGSFTGYKRIGRNTYWAEYKKEGDEYHLLNAYFHRMKIDLEAVWNGKRVQVDV